MTAGREVVVVGLKELQMAFRQVDREVPKGMRKAFLAIAKKVTADARGRMEFGAGEAMNSLQPRATQLGAGIARPKGGQPWQGEKADYEPWLDWGGTTGRGHGSSIVSNRAKGSRAGSGVIERPWVGDNGRYLYPAIIADNQFIRDELERLVKVAAEGAGFDTKEVR